MIPSLVVHLSCPALTSALKVLSINSNFPLFTLADANLRQALERLSLNSLTIMCPHTKLSDASWLDLRLPSLTTLDLPPDAFGGNTLSVVTNISPVLRHLSLSSPLERRVFLIPSATPVVLPRLETLHLSGYPVADLLPFFTSTPLRSISLDLIHRNGHDLVSLTSDLFLPSSARLPTSLQSLTLLIRSTRRPIASEYALRTSLAARNVALHVQWVPAPGPKFHDDGGVEHDVPDCHKARRTLREDLKWAGEVVDQLDRNEDVAGLKEIAEVLRRVREKRIIMEQ